VIYTDRLFLKKLSQKDRFFIFKLLNTENWIKYIGDRNIDSVAAAASYIRETKQKNKSTLSKIWTVRIKDSNIPIGIITFIKRDYLDFNDIGFAFLPIYSNKGYAFEATKAVLKKLDVNKVLAITLPQNKRAIKLIEKLGFQLEKIVEQDNKKLQVYRFKNDNES